MMDNDETPKTKKECMEGEFFNSPVAKEVIQGRCLGVKRVRNLYIREGVRRGLNLLVRYSTVIFPLFCVTHCNFDLDFFVVTVHGTVKVTFEFDWDVRPVVHVWVFELLLGKFTVYLRWITVWRYYATLIILTVFFNAFLCQIIKKKIFHFVLAKIEGKFVGKTYIFQKTLNHD